MVYDILAVNPGSTSTKIAVFRNRQEMFREDIEHDSVFLDSHPDIEEQFPFRRDMVLACLEVHSYQVEQLSAVVGRGGLLPPVKAGGYTVNQAMKDRILKGPISPHASNMGALIADAVATPLGIPAYIYDAVSSDEFMEISRITGIPEVVRQSFCHVLNSKAMARKAAEEAGKSYEEMNFLVAHMGGGISFSAHRHGKIVDASVTTAEPFPAAFRECAHYLYCRHVLQREIYQGRADAENPRRRGTESVSGNL